MKGYKNIAYWAVRVVAAVIMLQTLYFKFTASPESVYIFTTVGMEPWGRIGVGILELIAAALLLINTTAWMGGLLGLGLMAGAIGMHLTILGIAVPNADGSTDGGYLFSLAVVVTVCCVWVLLVNRERVKEYCAAVVK
jgi:putative oxidoreductase